MVRLEGGEGNKNTVVDGGRGWVVDLFPDEEGLIMM